LIKADQHDNSIVCELAASSERYMALWSVSVWGDMLKTETMRQARNVALKAHGQKTAYVVVLDADHTLDNVWRMRLACARLARECAHRYER
jgi:hypothetical protein